MHGNFIQLSRIARVERMKRPPKVMNIFPALTRVYSHLFFQILGGGGGNGGSGGGGGRASGSNSMKRNTPSEVDLLPNPNMFNPFGPGFYPDFAAGFPGLPLSMLNLLPPDRHPPSLHGLTIDEDCKSDRSKQSLEDDYPLPQPLSMNRDDRRELIQQNGQE